MEDEKYCFIAFGELALDVTYDETHIIKEVGGVSAFNTIYNLAMFGEEAYAVGGVGLDMNAIKAINSLKQSSTNTDNLEFVNKPTNVFYIYKPQELANSEEIPIGRESPITGKSSIEWSDKISTTLPEKFQNRNIILVVSNFEGVTKEFIKEAREKSKKSVISLDITNPKIFENKSSEYMWEYLKQINLLQCNQNTFKAVSQKLGISTPEELFSKLNLQIFTLTKGKEGALFTYREDEEIKQIEKTPEKIVQSVDPTGAGDAFHAMLLMAYHRKILNGEKLNKKYFDDAFKIANAFARKIVQIEGARGEQQETLQYMLNELTGINQNEELNIEL